MIFPSRTFIAAKKTGGCRYPVIVRNCSAAPFFIGRPGWVLSSACTWVFSSTHNTTALFRRVQIDTDNIRQFFHEALVFGQLESLHPVRLQTMSIPDALDSRMADTLSLCHGSCRPMCRSRQGRVQRGLHNGIDLFLASSCP